MKKIIVFVLILFAYITFVYSEPTDAQIQQIANTLGVPFEDLKQFVKSYQIGNTPSEMIEVTARQLAQEYHTNQVRSESQYYGKILKITGQVSRIFNIGNDYVLDLIGTDKYYSVFIYFPSSKANQISNLDPGQTVSIIGKCYRYDNPHVVIKEAHVTR
jgi:hypothetical protein